MKSAFIFQLNKAISALLMVASAAQSAPGPTGGAALSPASGPDREAPARARAVQVWEVRLPMRLTQRLRSCDLLDGFLFATGTDGVVRAIDATTGRVLWISSVVEQGEPLHPPVLHRTGDRPLVAFTRSNDVILLDLATGFAVNRVELQAPPVASAAVSTSLVFVPSVSGRLRSYQLRSGLAEFPIGVSGLLASAPVYVPAHDLLLGFDTNGVMAAITAAEELPEGASKRRVRFAIQTGARPVGRLGFDERTMYAATADGLLHAVDYLEGEPVWRYRLAGFPEGGPVVTAGSVYQAVLGGGVHRIGKEPMTPNWFDPQARQFLAEWPDGPALLRDDGSIVLINPHTGRAARRLDWSAGEAMAAVSNPRNDAIIMVSRRGRICCVRPAGARPLTPADFASPLATPQASAPTVSPGSETAAAREPGGAPPDDPFRSAISVPPR